MGRAEALFLPPVLKSGRRGVRVVEGARLESVYSGNAIAGSNPALSAREMKCPARAFLISRALKACFHKQVESKMRRREAPALHFF
jgi:hypothetical protein